MRICVRAAVRCAPCTPAAFVATAKRHMQAPAKFAVRRHSPETLIAISAESIRLKVRTRKQ